VPRRTPVTPSIVILLLTLAGIYFIWTGTSSPSKIEIGSMKIDSSSVGLLIIFLAVALIIVLVYLSRKGNGEPMPLPMLVRTNP